MAGPAPIQRGADADFLAGQIFARGLGLVLESQNVNQALIHEAHSQKSPFLVAPMIFLDSDKALESTNTLENDISAQIQSVGYAVITVDLTPAALDFLSYLTKTLPEKGMVLAPLSVLTARGSELSK